MSEGSSIAKDVGEGVTSAIVGWLARGRTANPFTAVAGSYLIEVSLKTSGTVADDEVVLSVRVPISLLE